MARLKYGKSFRGEEAEGTLPESVRWSTPDPRNERKIDLPPPDAIWAEVDELISKMGTFLEEAAATEAKISRPKSAIGKSQRRLANIKRRGAVALAPKIMLALGKLRGHGFSIPGIRSSLSQRDPQVAAVLDQLNVWDEFW